MKIQSLTGNWGYFGAVRERQEGGGGGQFNSPDGQKKKDSDPREDFSDSHFKEEIPSQDKMTEAVEAFTEDAQAKMNGLSASLEGSGPGLRVILKYGNGQIVRQFSGAEFVQFRNSVSKDSSSRGKILDQKL